MRWVEDYRPQAVAYVWQGGQEGGNGVLDVLSGKVNPCGKLSDTIAYCIEDYPSTEYYGNENENFQVEDIYVGYRYFETFAKEKVQYPFGFGLSYTEFEICLNQWKAAEAIEIAAAVKNTGNRAGKEVLQVYVSAPQGKLGKSIRALCGFSKTRELQPGESQEITFTIFTAQTGIELKDARIELAEDYEERIRAIYEARMAEE